MIYLHIPFCVRKCSYCGFYSRVGGDVQTYVDTLCREIELRAEEVWPKPHKVRTVYFGGGTPTLLSISQLGQIVEQLHRSFNLSEIEECTIEANPECLTKKYVADLRTMGLVNRVSVGVQSFSDADLRLLNRRHNGEDALRAVENLKERGYRNVSIDLIYGIPGQSAEQWQANLDTVKKLDIQHLSCYALTVEPGTILDQQTKSGRVMMPDEDEVLARYETLLEWCGSNGFTQYEISNFCREPYRSRHNSRYWDRTPYIGFGAAAHSFDGSHRRWNVADTTQYIKGVTARTDYFETETLSEIDAFNEYIMTALRTPEGIDIAKLDPVFADGLKDNILKYISAGYIYIHNGHYRPTEKGLLHADGIAADLIIA